MGRSLYEGQGVEGEEASEELTEEEERSDDDE